MAGCGPSDSSKEQITNADAKMLEKKTEEQQLLADSARATVQLVQRLRASVKMRDGLLMVDNESRTRLLFPISETTIASIPGAVSLSVLPLESPWVVNCGMGITVVFGNSKDDGSELVNADSKVWLTYVPVPKQVCEKLAPLIGKEIQAILSGR
jgi:hypothetical protein